MLATSRFVFIHLHKSGGTFVNECLMRFAPDAQEVHYHYPRRLIPEQFTHLPILGLVRNPWSYYVSWYAFQSLHPDNPIYRALSDDGRLDFEKTIRNMLELGSEGGYLDKVIEALPTTYKNGGFNVPGSAMEPIRNSGQGFYTHLYHHMYDAAEGGCDDVRMGRMEHLREDMLAMFAAVDQPISEEMRAHILQQPPANTSKHDDYTRYYGTELRDLVAERDADVIARHGYRFGENQV